MWAQSRNSNRIWIFLKLIESKLLCDISMLKIFSQVSFFSLCDMCRCTKNLNWRRAKWLNLIVFKKETSLLSLSIVNKGVFDIQCEVARVRVQSPRIRDKLASIQAQSSHIRDLHLHVLALGNVSFTCGWFCERGLIHHKPFWKHQAKPATFC